MGLEEWSTGEMPDVPLKNEWARLLAEFMESGGEMIWRKMDSANEAQKVADRLRVAATSKALKERSRYAEVYVGTRREYVYVRRL